MGDDLLSKGNPLSSPGGQPLWVFMTAVSGVGDEDERARLIATGLPSLLPCLMSGVALFREDERAWRLSIQRAGYQLAPSQAERCLSESESLFLEALRSPQPLIAHRSVDAGDRRIPPSIEALGVHTLAIAPLRTLHHRLGMVLVGLKESNSFSREEETLLTTLAEQSAVGLENLRMYQKLKRYSHTLEDTVEERSEKLRLAEERHRVLLEINNAIIANLDRESLLHATTQALRKVLPFDRATLTLLDPKRDMLRVHALATTTPAKRFLTPGDEFPRRGSPLESVYENKMPLIRHHLERGQRIGIEENLFKEGIHSYLAAPLIAKQEPFGTLNLGSRNPEEYTQADADFLTEVAQQVALAVENMLAYEQIAQLKAKLEQENLYLLDEIETEHGYTDLVGSSSALRAVLRKIEQVAPTDASVLISGESGTGKELVAREIHKRSRRQKRPLIRVNCASIPRELYESEFFGHVKGAFTGALKDRAGRFEIADGGTLFLDEVGEIPVELQGKLLRVLQEQEYERVGDERTRHVDVRIIAATNRDLQKEVETGRFRQDLFYRLNVFPIDVAPLRERKEDIPPLAMHLLQHAAKKLNREPPRVTQAQVTKLQSYDWPGNVRELQNVLERAVITSSGDTLRLDLAGAWAPEAPMPRSAAGMAEESSEVMSEAEMKRRERDNLLAALRRTDWRVYGPGGAAELLGVPPSTLISRIRKLRIKRPG